MKNWNITIKESIVRCFSCNTVVVGSGAAGYNAADRLWMFGQKDVVLVTEGVNSGTSRNTGSDKQTYYKLTLSGNEPDSVEEMAQTLFSGQCVDGDHALCEAALSVKCFLHLAELGVPFPQNRYGEYVGYKTDHDPKCRATSVGPYTSRKMVECLQKSAEEHGIPVFNHLQAIRILSDGKRSYGVLCLDLTKQEVPEQRFVAFLCKNLIWATGGPAGMYEASIYPRSQYGATGIALEAGAKGKNLTEWQYGMGSLHPRWNVSGSYMQVLPRFFSTNSEGGDEREFLSDWFDTPEQQLNCQFLKGYQWPFDVRKALSGSSVIDLLVYQELRKGRRVYLDYRKNPLNGNFSYEKLEPEIYEYLSKAGVCFGTPFERLSHMNRPAVEFYLEHDVDLSREALEISVCAQHNNGGIAVDSWWRTSLEGMFAVGEAAATHGVFRPGGSALNAGQVGSTRAAQFIAANGNGEADCSEACMELLRQSVDEMQWTIEQALKLSGNGAEKLWASARHQMTMIGASIRNKEEIKNYRTLVKQTLDTFSRKAGITAPSQIFFLFRLRDMLMSQYAYLSAMADYLEHGGRSRGSALYSDPEGEKAFEKLPEIFRFRMEDPVHENRIQEVHMKEGNCLISWRDVRPLPQEDYFFENVWRTFRENGNIIF